LEFYASDLRNKQKEISPDAKQRIRDAVLASPLFSDAEKARLVL